tara:strand:+ start:720 stop:908 length:189 start_codon:yes stop_codon:yes gene_type:complete
MWTIFGGDLRKSKSSGRSSEAELIAAAEEGLRTPATLARDASSIIMTSFVVITRRYSAGLSG